jgi:putative thioredoxin
LPESQVREFLALHVQPLEAPLADPAEEHVEAEAEAEAPEQSINRLQQEIAADPDKPELKLELAVALMQAGQIDAALAQLDALPAKLAVDARAVRLRSQLDLAIAAKDSPAVTELQARLQANPEDWEAHDQLGVHWLLEGDAAAGLDEFLLVLQRARDWNDGQARKRLLAAFATLDDAELVGRYRRRMASMLF